MTKGPKGFSDIEKDALRKKLCLECEHSWALHGYKKTSIGELTSKIGISTGAFYLLYPSKESLFIDTLEHVQIRLKNSILEIVNTDKGKTGFIKSIKWQFQEYDRSPFLYDFGTTDFLSFLNKLPKDDVEKLKFDGKAFFGKLVKLTDLELKVDMEKAFALTSTLLYTVTIKKHLNYNHFDTFDFLLDCVVDRLFE
jgi:Transcriptional regulator